MCGISGFCNFYDNFDNNREKWQKVLCDMRKSIAHRGNDQTSEYLSSNIGLSHTRLSIRDLSGGMQPMRRKIDGTEYAIVYNGEIYNTDAFVPDLLKKGYVFETTCDTEAVLYAYIAYGEQCVSMLNGIFSFAVWDEGKQQLMLCRDRLGVKPLFYTIKNKTLVFGSEIKALFSHPQITPEADEDSFRELFAIGPARTPGIGVFKNINEVVPGHTMLYNKSGLTDTVYWQLQASEHRDSYDQTVEKVSFLVSDAIRRQMVSDVPVCSFLSGGLDSSIITAVAAGCLKEIGGTLNTFSFDFAGNNSYFQSNSFQPTRDRPFVDIMLGSYPLLNHTYLECSEEALAEMLYDAVIAKDLPGMTDIDASLMYFCSLVKQQNKVALTGECADEIFGGYPWFYRKEMLYADGFPWSHNLSARTVMLKDDVTAKLHLSEYAKMRYDEALRSVPKTGSETAEESRRREISFLNIRWFMQTLLDRMDRASMSCGLEARVPFADHRIVEYLYNVPWDMKYHDETEKALLRDAFQDMLPSEILYRKKSPYPKTYNPNYERLLCIKLKRVLADKNAPINAYVDKSKAEVFLRSSKNYGEPWFGQLMAGPQMIAYLLQINEWMKHFGL